MSNFNENYTFLGNLSMAVQQILGYVNNDETELTNELEAKINCKAAAFVEWEQDNMPKDEKGWPDWEQVIFNKITVQSFYGNDWHTVCDWDDALQHWWYNGELPRIVKHETMQDQQPSVHAQQSVFKENLWEFIEGFMPGYYQSEDIAFIDDALKYLDNEFSDEENEKYLKRLFPTKQQAFNDYAETLNKCATQAMQTMLCKILKDAAEDYNVEFKGI